MKALIITHSNDNESVGYVTRALEQRGAGAFRLDTDLFPTEVRLAASFERGEERVKLVSKSDEVELAHVCGIWHRRLSIAQGLPATLDAQLRHASVEESRRTLLGVLSALELFVIDPLAKIRRAEHKPLQLRIARELGIETPRTLFTNDPDSVREFAASCGGKIITKMMASFAVYENGEERVVFTNPVSEQDLGDLDGLRLCPMTFQQTIEKQLELRVTIVGDRVFCAAVDSQALARSRNDWRREGVALLEQWKPHALPAELVVKLLRLQDALGLNYGAIDLILTPGGRYVFLEVNPVGEFFWLEREPGFPVSGAIADVLLGRAARRE